MVRGRSRSSGGSRSRSRRRSSSPTRRRRRSSSGGRRRRMNSGSESRSRSRSRSARCRRRSRSRSRKRPQTPEDPRGESNKRLMLGKPRNFLQEKLMQLSQKSPPEGGKKSALARRSPAGRDTGNANTVPLAKKRKTGGRSRSRSGRRRSRTKSRSRSRDRKKKNKRSRTRSRTRSRGRNRKSRSRSASRGNKKDKSGYSSIGNKLLALANKKSRSRSDSQSRSRRRSPAGNGSGRRQRSESSRSGSRSRSRDRKKKNRDRSPLPVSRPAPPRPTEPPRGVPAGGNANTAPLGRAAPRGGGSSTQSIQEKLLKLSSTADRLPDKFRKDDGGKQAAISRSPRPSRQRGRRSPSASPGPPGVSRSRSPPARRGRGRTRSGESRRGRKDRSEDESNDDRSRSHSRSSSGSDTKERFNKFKKHHDSNEEGEISEDSEDEKKRQRRGRGIKKRKRNRKSGSSPPNDSSLNDSTSKKKKKKKKGKKAKRKEKRVVELKKSIEELELEALRINAARSKRAPMTKEAYEKQQSEVRREYDEDTGRVRLVKGTGEILEECVSRERQREINKAATKGNISIRAEIESGVLERTETELEEGEVGEVSRLPERFLLSQSSLPNQSLLNQSLLNQSNFNQSLLTGPLNRSESQPGLLDRYLLSQSSQDVENLLETPNSLVGLPEVSLLQSIPLDQSSLAAARQLSTPTRLQESDRESFHSPESSADELSVSSNQSSSALQQLVVEAGQLDNSSHSVPADLAAALSSRDAVIQRLSASLTRLLQERQEDGTTSSQLEEDVTGLREQVRLALAKASHNKEFRVKYQELRQEHDLQTEQVNALTEEMGIKESKLEEVEKVLQTKVEEISTFESAKLRLIEQLQSIQNEVRKKAEKEDSLDRLKIKHIEEIGRIKEVHEKELQELSDKYQEEQVVEINLLDMELENLRDEKRQLLNQVESLNSENEKLRESKASSGEEVEAIQGETSSLIEKYKTEHELALERIKVLQNKFNEETTVNESLMLDLQRERGLRETLEADLVNIGSVLDDTQYQFLSHEVRQSLERSVRLSLESGALSPSRRESGLSLVLAGTAGQARLSTASRDIEDTDVTPTHQPREQSDLVEALRAEHEQEMSELRKYFENVCAELEAKYRAEIEDSSKRQVGGSVTPAWQLLPSLPSAPVSLELHTAGPGVEFEFESMSPRSGFSSDNNQLSFSSNYHHSREHSGLSDNEGNTGISAIRKQLEDEILFLNRKVEALQREIDRQSAAESLAGKTVREEFETKIQELVAQHEAELQQTQVKVRKELETDHMQKFSQVSKQIQSLQKSEIDSLKAALTEEHSKKLKEATEKFASEIEIVENAVKDIQESHKLEILELERKHKAQLDQTVQDHEKLREITPEIYQTMRVDLDKMEHEKASLKSLQGLMKELMQDLATHYDLSEKQVRLLSDSTLFDSFTLSLTPANTPFKYFPVEGRSGGGGAGAEESLMSSLIAGAEAGELAKLGERVRQSNTSLAELQRRLEIGLSPRSSLETAANRTDVVAGCGEAGQEAGQQVGEEVRERAAQLVTAWQEGGAGETTMEPVQLITTLEELLLYTDTAAGTAQHRLEDAQQQLEVADKQLRATRVFLDQQAVEREQEREDWERRLQQEVEAAAKREPGNLSWSRDSPGPGETVEEGGSRTRLATAALQAELTAAVDKIYELREIIVGLEGEVERRTRAEQYQTEAARGMRTALEEAMLGHQLLQQELQLLRGSSSDAEFVEHIRGLEEQLVSHTAELRRGRAAAGQVEELRAQLRVVGERLEQNTRQLHTSLLGPGQDCRLSTGSSRESTPLPPRDPVAGSYEDIASSVSGMEVEELTRLEKKLKDLEKAERAAVEKVGKLEGEKLELERGQKQYKETIELKETRVQELQTELDAARQAVTDCQAREARLESEARKLEAGQDKLDEVEAERELLQERVTQQQMQISSLQSALQSSRHKTFPPGREEVQKLQQEKEGLRAELEDVRSALRIQEAEKFDAIDKVNQLSLKLLGLEAMEVVNCTACAKLRLDNAELAEVAEKLQCQLGQARAAQFSAQQTEMPLLAQQLIEEKNREIEALHGRLESWSSRLEESSTPGGPEQLRDQTAATLSRSLDLSLSHIRPNSTLKHFPGSGQKLQTIQENESLAETPEGKPVARKLPINSSELEPELHLTVADSALEPSVNDVDVGLEKENTEKKDENANLFKLLKEKEDLVENLKNEVINLESELAEANEKHVEAISALENNPTGMGGNEQLHQDLVQYQRVMEDQSSKVEALIEKNQQLEQMLSESSKRSLEMEKSLIEKAEYVTNLEQQLSRLANNVREMEGRKISVETELLHRSSTNLVKVAQEKEVLEQQLEKVTMEMASVQKVVAEMTNSFKQQISSKDGDLRKVTENLVSITALKKELEKNNTELATIDKNNKARIYELESLVAGLRETPEPGVEQGSLEDLSNLVQAELDLSTELDNTLLSQVVTGLDTRPGSSQSGLTELQRLIKKIQGEGIDVLSLSERLFLMQHANVSKNLSLKESDGGSKERELERKVEVLEIQVEQERFLIEDLKKSLSTEKRNCLDSLNKITKERRARAELELQIGKLEKELDFTKRKLLQLQSQNSDSQSDREDFLQTIDTQKQQLESLEEAVRQERRNFSQVQAVLQTERGRGRARGQQEAQLGQLQQELSTAEAKLAGERQQYQQLYTEYEFLKKVSQSPTPGQDSGSDVIAAEKLLRGKNFELERQNCELEVKLEQREEEVGRLRAVAAVQEEELARERERHVSGLSTDQLARMQQVNTFLELNLKENGEMLASLARLYEEKLVMSRRAGELETRLESCVCLGSDPRTFYGKFLRSESFRKALVWQKRYLLVLLCGELSPDPVLRVPRPGRLHRGGRFRAVVQAVVAVTRMRYLVRRWRTGKRAGAHAPTVLPLELGSSSPRPSLSRTSSLRSPRPGPALSPAPGHTPPTRDTTVRRSSSSAGTGAQSARRSLTARSKDSTLAAVEDPDLRRDLETYIQRFGNLQQNRAKHV